MQNAYEEHRMLERLVNSWHDAINRRDVSAAQALVTDPVEVSGPRGAHTISAQAFADWVAASGIRLRPLSAHPVDGVTMVVEQEATWPDDTGSRGATTPPTAVATLFKASGGALSVIRRFESLHEALRAAGTETPQP
jgi:hypothetical protein